MNLFSLEGKTALVTGGNQGLGKAFAFALAEAGPMWGSRVAAPKETQPSLRWRLQPGMNSSRSRRTLPRTTRSHA